MTRSNSPNSPARLSREWKRERMHETFPQKKDTVKDVQGLLRHARSATTTDVYMQEIPESVQATVNAIHAELKSKPKTGQGN